MKKGFTFKNRHSDTFGITMQSKSRPILPEMKAYTYDAPLLDGVYDFSSANAAGRAFFQNRTVTVIMQMTAADINALEEKHDSDIAEINTSLASKATSAELANTELNLKHDVDQKLEETKAEISNDIDLAVAQSASSLRSEITGATKDKVDKATISLTSTDTVKLYSNTETRLVSDDVSSLVLTVPSFFDLYYQCYLSFKSGDTPTTLTYSDTPIKWVGVDCDSDGDFVPTANKIYEVAIKNVGGGFDASSGGTNGEPIIVARVGVC